MKHKVEVEFEEFGWAALTEAAEREGVSVDELLVHAAMYYLGDQDAKRASRRVFRPSVRRPAAPESADFPTAPWR
jgi:hypothetical protein